VSAGKGAVVSSLVFVLPAFDLALLHRFSYGIQITLAFGLNSMRSYSDWLMLLLLSYSTTVALFNDEEVQPRREFFYVGGEHANFTVPVVGRISSLQTILTG
jgi:hypothetical protein